MRDGSAEHLRHGLEAVADAENRDIQIEYAGIELRRALFVDARRTTGEHDRPGLRPLISSTLAECGITSENTRASRTRRAISCAYCAPKSMTRTGLSPCCSVCATGLA